MKQTVINHKKEEIKHTNKIINRARTIQLQNMTREVLHDFVNVIVLLSAAIRFRSFTSGTNSLKFI